jgi:L-threonylcarbamoyladenylate synthase
MSPAVERSALRGWAFRGDDPATLETELIVAIDAARAGRPVVYPSETGYGVGSALRPEGIASVRAAGRGADAGRAVALVAEPEVLDALAWTEEARALARLFWPGALTLVLRDPECAFPEGVRSPRGTVAVRCTSHPVAAALIAAVGGRLASTSANRPGMPPASTAEAAAAFAADLAADPALAGSPPHFVDAGDLPHAASSTLVDCAGDAPRVLREGAVPIGRLRCALPDLGSAPPETA